ncbi:MAG: DNA-3-methyladenine glycosylase family protein [bacterium]
MLSCPPGFDFHATATVMRRGPADPLVWYDGRRWRRRLAVDGAACLVEAVPADGGLAARVLAGRASRPHLERTVARLFGLDDPARALSPRLPATVRRAVGRLRGTAALPGYPTLFEALVHTILGQQISATAANAHRAAFTRRFGRPFAFRGGTYWMFSAPGDVAGERLASLRRPGLSTAKAVAVRAVARAFDRGTVSDAALEALPPDAAIATLTALPGIGRWTAEWVLLRALRRFDVVPAGDLAVRKAVSWLAGREELLSEPEVRELAAPWTPYAGLVAFRLLLAHRQTFATPPARQALVRAGGTMHAVPVVPVG